MDSPGRMKLLKLYLYVEKENKEHNKHVTVQNRYSKE